MFVFILFMASNIVFINNKSKDLIKNYSLHLLIILVCFTHISLMSKLFISGNIAVNVFYLGSILLIALITGLIMRKYASL